MSFGDDVNELATLDPLAGWQAFTARVRERLEAGRAAYGDRSFSVEPAELVRELQQEALDLAGWGYVLWTRLEAMRRALPAVDVQVSQGAERASQANVGARQPPSTGRGCPGRLVGAERGRETERRGA